MSTSPITSPVDSALDNLCGELRGRADQLDASGEWPAEQLRLCGEHGVFQWFISPEWGGQAWSEEDVLRGYLALSSGCLTTTFVLTQRTGACSRLATSKNAELQRELLPRLASGELFATVGISHLTTSRRHLARPALRAYRADGGFVLDGFSPWVTGARFADYVVVGAVLMDGETPTSEQLLVATPTDRAGVVAGPPAELVGVGASHTGPLQFDQVFLENRWLLAGPVENVMTQGAGGSTGGLQTSTLAVGLARAAIGYVEEESRKRPELDQPHAALREECRQLEETLFAVVHGEPACSKEQLRARANSLALRSAQASLAAAKGAGYVVGHPAGRWCREALFFLVWSCPQPVVSANLCELAGIVD